MWSRPEQENGGEGIGEEGVLDGWRGAARNRVFRSPGASQTWADARTCGFQLEGRLSLSWKRSSTPAAESGLETVEACENFVEGVAELSFSLRLLDCGSAGGNWHARSGRLELNDGRRHLEQSRRSLDRYGTESLEVGVRLRCLDGLVGRGFGEGKGRLREGRRGPSEGF